MQCNVHSKWITARQGQGHTETVASGRHETQTAVVAARTTLIMSPETHTHTHTHARARAPINVNQSDN
jgi:hypothetical protein